MAKRTRTKSQTMAKRTRTKSQTMVKKTLHRKLKNEQRQPH